ncbi:MAG: RidA family protein [Vicinamibacterales bacterium]
MSITRVGITTDDDGYAVMSRAVIRHHTVYLCGIVPDAHDGDIVVQTRQVLAKIDAMLQANGTDKSKLLTAQVWIADMKDFMAMNTAWNAWVDRKNPPVRACVQAALYHPEVLVEMMVTAAL